MAHIEPSVISTALTLAFCVLVYNYARSALRWRARTQGRPLPPGPRGIPILGNLFDIPKSKPWVTYRHLSNTYGDIVHLRAFGQSIVVLGDVNVTFEYLDKRSANTSDRHQTRMVELAGVSWNLGFFPYGQWWRRHRRALWQQFYRRATIKYQPTLRDVTHKFLWKLLTRPSNLISHIRYTFAATSLKVLYGIDIILDDDPYMKLIDDALEGIGQGMVPGKFLVEFLPFLRHIPAWFPGASSQRLFRKWQAAGDSIRNVPYAHMQVDIARRGIQNEPDSIVGQLIAGLDNVPDEELTVETDIAKNVGGVALEAGADTMFSTLQGLFLALSLNPEVVHKAQEELERVVGPDRLPDFDDEESLTYIQAIILETLRWHVVVPFAIPHATTEDDELHGYFIPAGTILIPNSWAYLHDPDVYEEPEAFRPERFIKDGKIDVSSRNPVDFAFGYGRRICPGRHFAMSSLFINTAMVLHVFDIGPPLDENGRPIKIKHAMSDGFLSYPEDCRCTIKPRSPRAEELIRAQNKDIV